MARYQIASSMLRAESAITARLARSLNAKTIGASCIVPRKAHIQIRVTQKSVSAKVAHSACGWRYNAFISGVFK
jgi:hypothetical protein